MFDSSAELFFHTYPNTPTFFILKLILRKLNRLINDIKGYKNNYKIISYWTNKRNSILEQAYGYKGFTIG